MTLRINALYSDELTIIRSQVGCPVLNYPSGCGGLLSIYETECNSYIKIRDKWGGFRCSRLL